MAGWKFRLKEGETLPALMLSGNAFEKFWVLSILALLDRCRKFVAYQHAIRSFFRRCLLLVNDNALVNYLLWVELSFFLYTLTLLSS